MEVSRIEQRLSSSSRSATSTTTTVKRRQTKQINNKKYTNCCIMSNSNTFIVQLTLIAIVHNLMICTINSLSISTTSSNGNNNNNKLTNYQSSSLSTLLSQTTLSPMSMVPTTLVYNIQQQQQKQQQQDNSIVKPSLSGAISSLQQQQQQPQQKMQSAGTDGSPTTSPSGQSIQMSIHQRERDDREDLPSATINNHSRNNHQSSPVRPPQYVDVSALVNRERNSSFSSSLSPKSRSGLPECATQQVCNAIFVRMNYTQKLCECSSNYNWKCSFSSDAQDGHTIELTRKFDKRIYTQIKTCEPLREVRACKSPTDWTLLALQSERSGKAHYVVVCKCPTWAQLEGPYTHNHPPYANIPGIRVYGMLCAHQTARSNAFSPAFNPQLSPYPEFPWSEALSVLNSTNINSPTKDNY